jgi:hypothetical protein
LLLLIIGIESALIIGLRVGFLSGIRLDVAVKSIAEDAHAAGVAQGRAEVGALNEAREEGHLDALRVSQSSGASLAEAGDARMRSAV